VINQKKDDKNKILVYVNRERPYFRTAEKKTAARSSGRGGEWREMEGAAHPRGGLNVHGEAIQKNLGGKDGR
jgi:hypothetical protein